LEDDWGLVSDIKSNGSSIFVSEAIHGIHVYGVSQGEIQKISEMHHEQSFQIELSGNILLSRGRGIKIFDVENPASPFLVESFDDSGVIATTNDWVVLGLYSASYDTHTVYLYHNEMNSLCPVDTMEFITPPGNDSYSYRLYLDNENLVIKQSIGYNDHPHYQLFNLSIDGFNEIEHEWPIDIHALKLVGPYFYFFGYGQDNSYDLRRIDITVNDDTTGSVIRENCILPSWEVLIDDERIYLAFPDAQKYEVADWEGDVPGDWQEYPIHYDFASWTLHDNMIFCAQTDPDGIYWHDYSESNPDSGYFRSEAWDSQDMVIRNNLGYCVGDSLRILDLTNPSNPVRIASYALPRRMTNVQIYNGNLFISSGRIIWPEPFLLQKYSFDSNGMPLLENSIEDTSKISAEIIFHEDLIYVAVDCYPDADPIERGIKIFDTEDLSLVQFNQEVGFPFSMIIHNNILYTEKRIDIVHFALQCYDISDINNIELLCQQSLPDLAYQFNIHSNLLIFNTSQGIYSYNIQNPEDPYQEYFYQMEDYSYSFDIQDSLLAVAKTDHSSFQVFSLANLNDPALLINGSRIKFPFQPNIMIHEGHVYISDHTIIEVFDIGSILSVRNEPDITPNQLYLSDPYPNPFNPSTKISYFLPEASEVNLGVFNIMGQEVFRVLDSNRSAGNHQVNIDMSEFSSGVYFIRMNTKHGVLIQRATLVK